MIINYFKLFIFFVLAGGGSRTPSLAGFKYAHGLNKDSREATLQQGKQNNYILPYCNFKNPTSNFENSNSKF